jgi:hypothetical protein
MREWYHRLLRSWDARPVDKKFQIVCMFHHGDDMQFHDGLIGLVQRGALRILTISEQ